MHMKCSCGMQGGLLVEFENNAGHSVLLMKAGFLPTLATADFTFRSKEFTKGDQVFHPLESAYTSAFNISFAQIGMQGADILLLISKVH